MNAAPVSTAGIATWSLRCALLAVLLVVLSVIAGVANRPVQWVSVDGVLGPGEAQTVSELIRWHASRGLLFMDLGDLVADIEAHSWVINASVRRRWPATLELSVQTRVPVARWGAGRYLSADGRVVDGLDPAAYSRLPVLIGGAGDEGPIMQRFQLLSRLLRPIGLQVSRLEFDKLRRWRLELSNGVEVRFGTGDVNSRVQRFIELYRNRLHERSALIESIDVRYADGIAVAWRGDSVFKVTP